MKKGSHHSPESITKMIKIQNSPEVLDKQRKSHLGQKNAFYGKHHSPEIKEKIRLAFLGKPRSPEIRAKISVGRHGIHPGNYKGGEIKRNGYIWTWKPEHPFCNSSNYVFKSHVTIEKLLRFFLPKGVAVHHINQIIDDDRPENLIAFKSNSAHMRFHAGHIIKSNEIIFDGRKFHAKCTS